MKAALSAPTLSPPAMPLEQLLTRARKLVVRELESRQMFDEQHYVRKILHWEPGFEIVLLCWNAGQSSSIHDHNGSTCVTRVLGGRFLERLFREDAATGLFAETGARMMNDGDVSGVDGRQLHQVTNAQARGRGTLLNLYSPALSPAPRSSTGSHLAVSLS